MIKRILLTVLLVIWMGIIFIFSNQNATKSQSTSDKLVSNVIDTVEVIAKEKIKQTEKKELIENTRFVVRKIAHFTLFFVLGILVFLTLSSYSIDKLILCSFIICLLYACSDEIHQLFLVGRTAKILDIFIDTIGSSFGISLAFAIKYKKQYNNRIML